MYLALLVESFVILLVMICEHCDCLTHRDTNVLLSFVKEQMLDPIKSTRTTVMVETKASFVLTQALSAL